MFLIVVFKIRVYLRAQWVASDLAPLVNLVQGYVGLGVKVLVFSSSFLLVLQVCVAIFMVIVASRDDRLIACRVLLFADAWTFKELLICLIFMLVSCV